MMKLGLLTAILPDMTFEEVVDYASEVGYGALEVCCWPKGKAVRRYAGVTHIDVDTLTREKAAYYVDYAKKKNIEIAALAYFPNPLSDDIETAKVARNHIKKVIKAAALMQVPVVTTFIGKNKTLTIEENLKQMKKVWPAILKVAEDSGVRVAIENCPMSFTKDEWPGGNNLASTPYVWRQMFDMSPNMGLCYDPSHLVLQGMSVNKPLMDFSERIFHVHFKDMQIDLDKVEEYGRFSYPSLWHTPKIPGLGDVNFPKFIAKLHDIGYQGAGCLEMEDRSFEGSMRDTKKGIQQSYRYLKTLMD